MSRSKSQQTLPVRNPHQDVRPSNPNDALFRDALDNARGLKRKHRALYEANHKAFRATVSKAHSRVFRIKPGPKDDPHISGAAREVALRARVEDVFRREFPHRRPGNDNLYAMALENFRGKVDAYIRKHPRLKRLRDRRTRSVAEPAQPNPVPNWPDRSAVQDSTSTSPGPCGALEM